MAQIKQLSNAIELSVKGSDRKIKVDFTDKRLVNKLLKLIKKYKNVEELVKEKMKSLDEITDGVVELIKSMGIDIETKEEISDENIETFLNNKVSADKRDKVKEIIADGNMDLLIAASDIEIDILQDFKDEVNNAFNAPITDIMFGDTLPPLEYYVELFEAITPYIQKAKEAENKTLQAITEKYKLNNVVDFPERTEI